VSVPWKRNVTEEGELNKKEEEKQNIIVTCKKL
jgi:hypothetical protein